MSANLSTSPDGAVAARAAGLVYVTDAEPGIRRRRQGEAFAYVDLGGNAIEDEDTLARIRALAIPPAYTDVWICPDPDGHLQATGRDAKGRKQYRYHADWAQVRGDGKFERVIAFGEALPKLRRQLKKDLALPGFPREKVLAIVVSVMARTLIRVGNDCYARNNRSFGLTTLRNRHVGFLRGGRAKFAFRGKSGHDHEIVLDDAQLVRLVKRCQQLPGQALFQYVDDAGATQPIGSAQVNDYLREALGETFTAKDFRTWGGTLAAIGEFARTEVPEGASEREMASIEKSVVAAVAEQLGNTPAVCRKAYIDPAVVEGWRGGRLQQMTAGARSGRSWELAALRLLRDARRRAAASSREARKALHAPRRRVRAAPENPPLRTHMRARSPKLPVGQAASP